MIKRFIVALVLAVTLTIAVAGTALADSPGAGGHDVFHGHCHQNHNVSGAIHHHGPDIDIYGAGNAFDGRSTGTGDDVADSDGQLCGDFVGGGG